MVITGEQVYQVRLLIGDTKTPYKWAFEEIEGMLLIYEGNIKRASANLILQAYASASADAIYIKTDDLVLDDTKTVSGLLNYANRLLAEADAEDEALNSYFTFVPRSSEVC